MSDETVRSEYPGASKKPVLRVLSAEDHKLYAEMVIAIYEKSGHVVDPAADGQEAFERIEAAPGSYDLLVTDHQMPRLDGLGLVGRLRARGFVGKIIVHSSKLTENDIVRYRGYGVDCIAMKGQDTGDLAEIAQQLFSPE
jgi:DNA-binding response OmpR family regulator